MHSMLHATHSGLASLPSVLAPPLCCWAWARPSAAPTWLKSAQPGDHMCAPFFTLYHLTPRDTTTPVTVVSVTTMSSFVVQRRGPCELLTHSCASEVPLTRTCDAHRHRDRSPLNFSTHGSRGCWQRPTDVYAKRHRLRGSWHRQESL